MAAYDFPDTAGQPSDGSFTYTAPDGTLYEWNGYAWQVPDSGNPGGGGGGNFEIPTQALPPAGAADGDMFWCTDDGRLYIYYEDADTSQWVDASPDNTPEAVDNYWAKSGSTLSPIDTADSVDIGSGNITLNADGSAEFFGGEVEIRNANIGLHHGNFGTEPDSNMLLFTRDQAYMSGNVPFGILDGRVNDGGTLTSACQFRLIRDDGAGYSTGGCFKFLTNTGNSGVTEKVRIRESGEVQIGGTLPSAPNIALNADGSSKFKERMSVEASAGPLLSLKRNDFIQGVTDNSKSYAVFDVYDANDLRTARYAADGTIFLGNSTTSSVSGPGNSQISLNSEGSASFAGGELEVSNAGRVTTNNYFAAFRPTAGSAVITGGVGDMDSYTTNVLINADGSATFAGKVTASNVTFNLEADDDTKYTATTDADGNETRVYNGAVLDVKERIQNVISRMDAIEANEVTDDATDSALLTLVASLSSRLDERDATIAALTTRITTLEIQSNGGN